MGGRRAAQPLNNLGKPRQVLLGPQGPGRWACSKCGKTGLWANRVICNGGGAGADSCGQHCPDKVFWAALQAHKAELERRGQQERKAGERRPWSASSAAEPRGPRGHAKPGAKYIEGVGWAGEAKPKRAASAPPGPRADAGPGQDGDDSDKPMPKKIPRRKEKPGTFR